jgi:hypothetical protein
VNSSDDDPFVTHAGPPITCNRRDVYFQPHEDGDHQVIEFQSFQLFGTPSQLFDLPSRRDSGTRVCTDRPLSIVNCEDQPKNHTVKIMYDAAMRLVIAQVQQPTTDQRCLRCLLSSSPCHCRRKKVLLPGICPSSTFSHSRIKKGVEHFRLEVGDFRHGDGRTYHRVPCSPKHFSWCAKPGVIRPLR